MEHLSPPGGAQDIILCPPAHDEASDNEPTQMDRAYLGLRLVSKKEWYRVSAFAIPAVLCLPLHPATLLRLAGAVSDILHDHKLYFHFFGDGPEGKFVLAEECPVHLVRIEGPLTVLLRDLGILLELLLRETSEDTNRLAHYSPRLLVGLQAWFEVALRELKRSEEEGQPFRCLTVWRSDDDWFTQPPPLPYTLVSGRMSSSLTLSFPRPIKL